MNLSKDLFCEREARKKREKTPKVPRSLSLFFCFLSLFLFLDSLRELPAVGDDDLLGRRAGPAAVGLDLLDDVHALGDAAEDDVLAVEPRRLDGAEEELARF